VLQCVAVCCSVLQCVQPYKHKYMYWFLFQRCGGRRVQPVINLRFMNTATHCNTLQHTATHCNTLQRTATPVINLRYMNTTTHCTTLQHTATHCNTLQHTATPVINLRYMNICHDSFAYDMPYSYVTI